MFHDLSCPSCGAPGLEAANDERVACRYCGDVYAGSRVFCANCQHVNPEDAEHCEKCGDPLARSCPACDEKNWIGAEYCAHCGRPLDILEYLYQSHRLSTAERLNLARQAARAIKAEENAAAERRSADLWEIERRRQQALAVDAARQGARDRQTILMIVAGIFVFGAALIVAGLLLAAR